MGAFYSSAAVPSGFGNLVKSFMAQHNTKAPNDIGTMEDGRAILQAVFISPEFSSIERDNIIMKIPSAGKVTHVNLEVVDGCLHDIFFDPSNPESFSHAFLSTLLNCPVDLRLGMVRNISMVGGGVSGIPNFENMLLKSVMGFFNPTGNSGVLHGTVEKFRTLEPAVTNSGPLGIIHPLPFPPNSIAWLGASIMGTLEMSDERWVYRQSFMEHDEQIQKGSPKAEKEVSRIYDFLFM